MKITNRIVRTPLFLKDLQPGDVFYFVNDEKTIYLFLGTPLLDDYCYTNFEEIYSIDDDVEENEVKLLDCEMIVYKEL